MCDVMCLAYLCFITKTQKLNTKDIAETKHTIPAAVQNDEKNKNTETVAAEKKKERKKRNTRKKNIHKKQ